MPYKSSEDGKRRAREAQKKWRDKNPHKLADQRSRWYQKYKDKITEYRNDPENKERRKEYDKEYRIAKKAAWMEAIVERKGSIACERCGYDKSFSAMDFHHKDPNEKDTLISYLMCLIPTEERVAEIDKCMLVCRNCHSEIHEVSV